MAGCHVVPRRRGKRGRDHVHHGASAEAGAATATPNFRGRLHDVSVVTLTVGITMELLDARAGRSARRSRGIERSRVVEPEADPPMPQIRCGSSPEKTALGVTGLNMSSASSGVRRH